MIGIKYKNDRMTPHCRKVDGRGATREDFKLAQMQCYLAGFCVGQEVGYTGFASDPTRDQPPDGKLAEPTPRCTLETLIRQPAGTGFGSMSIERASAPR